MSGKFTKPQMAFEVLHRAGQQGRDTKQIADWRQRRLAIENETSLCTGGTSA